MSPSVVVLDHGSGNVRSAVRALQRAGADVALTADTDAALTADGLVVPGVGAFAAVAAAVRAVGGDRVVAERLAADRPVLGICVGLQVLFERSGEPGAGDRSGLGVWRGEVSRLRARRVPHMGWNVVEPPPGSRLFAGPPGERFYFVHSYAAAAAPEPGPGAPAGEPLVTWCTHEGARFVAAVEHGALAATQFHPEKSGDAGAALLARWVAGLTDARTAATASVPARDRA